MRLRRRRPRASTVGSPPARSRRPSPARRSAAVDDRDLVAGLLDLVEQVRREEHGAALVDERADEAAHLEDAGRVEAVHRLVEDQQRGVGEQAAGDAEPLAHAERVRLHAVAGALAPGRPARATASMRPSASRLARGGDDLAGSRGRSGGGGSAAPRRSRRRARAPRARCAGLRQAEQRASRRTSARVRPSSMRISVVLPAPFGPRKPKATPRGHEQVDVVDGDAVAEALRQAVGLDRRLFMHRMASAPAARRHRPRGRIARRPARRTRRARLLLRRRRAGRDEAALVRQHHGLHPVAEPRACAGSRDSAS